MHAQEVMVDTSGEGEGGDGGGVSGTGVGGGGLCCKIKERSENYMIDLALKIALIWRCKTRGCGQGRQLC